MLSRYCLQYILKDHVPGYQLPFSDREPVQWPGRLQSGESWGAGPPPPGSFAQNTPTDPGHYPSHRRCVSVLPCPVTGRAKSHLPLCRVHWPVPLGQTAGRPSVPPVPGLHSRLGSSGVCQCTARGCVVLRVRCCHPPTLVCVACCLLMPLSDWLYY